MNFLRLLLKSLILSIIAPTSASHLSKASWCVICISQPWCFFFFVLYVRHFMF